MFSAEKCATAYVSGVVSLRRQRTGATHSGFGVTDVERFGRINVRWLKWGVIACLSGAVFLSPAESKMKAQTLTMSSTLDAHDKAQIVTLEKAWTAALNDGDVKALSAILAEDFNRPDPQSGKFVGKQELLRYYSSPQFREHHHRVSIADMQVNLYGGVAIARGHVVASDDRCQPVSTVIFTDVFVRRNDRWQAVSAQENSITCN